jgi:hypothetical protein
MGLAVGRYFASWCRHRFPSGLHRTRMTSVVMLTPWSLQILEKHVHQEAPAAAKLWSPLRLPLNAFFCQHPAAIVAYFLDVRRLFSMRQDYFWLLHDLALHPSGGPLLDALCSSEHLWVTLLDQIISELPEEGTSPCPIQCFETLHLMASIVEVRPLWLSEQPKLWPKVIELWEHRGRHARMAKLKEHGVHERMETAMLCKLILSYVDQHAEELPRLLDLFTMFEFPVRLPALDSWVPRSCKGWTFPPWALVTT